VFLSNKDHEVKEDKKENK